MSNHCVNRASILGFLGATPTLRQSTQRGLSVTNLSLATNRSRLDSSGEWADEVTWHRVVVWGKKAEAVCAALKKGDRCYVEGRMQNHTYVNKEGVKIESNEIVADQIIFLNNRNEEVERLSVEDVLDNLSDE